MSRSVTHSDFVQKTIVCKPYETTTVDFIDIRPNYYRVQNMGAARIYMGVSKMPTDHDYEFSCKPESFAMYTEPHNRGFMYIYNPSGSDVVVRILAFAAEFDPLALAFSQIEIDFAGLQLQTLGAITEFQAALPAGSNKIGKVDVASLPALPAGSNVIGKFNVNNWPTDYAKAANQKDYTEAIAGIHKQNYVDHVSAFNLVDNQGEQVISNGGHTLIHMLTNDGETDFNLVLGDVSMPLKPGETITDLKFNGSVKLNGETYSARMLVSYP